MATRASLCCALSPLARESRPVWVLLIVFKVKDGSCRLPAVILGQEVARSVGDVDTPIYTLCAISARLTGCVVRYWSLSFLLSKSLEAAGALPFSTLEIHTCTRSILVNNVVALVKFLFWYCSCSLCVIFIQTLEILHSDHSECHFGKQLWVGPLLMSEISSLTLLL